MATNSGIEDVGRPIARLFGEGSASGMDEGELLRRFADGRDPLALEVLIARHGPMVLGVCRRVLGKDRHASEDAFQATFLVLARKAGAIRDPDRLGPWLHGVAHRVAVRARADLARRNAREKPGAEDLAMETSPADEAGFDRLELRAALDEEVRRLPEKFRDPIVLCYLDGLTHDEAATRLHCPVGTVRSRLSTARAKLRERLARRGVTVPAGLFAAVLTAEGATAAVSPPLLITTVKAATAFAGGLAGATAAGMVSAEVASLAEGVSKTMILSKLKTMTGLALAGMLTVGAGGVAAYQVGGPGQDAKVEKPADESPEAVIRKLRDQLELARAEALTYKLELREARAELKTVRDWLQDSKPKESVAPAPGKTGKAAVGGMGAGFSGAAAAPAPNPTPGSIGGTGVGGAAAGLAPSPSPSGIGGGSARGLSGGVGAIGTRPGPRTAATFQSDDFVIVQEPDSGKLASYSTETGQWTSYETPKGVEQVPIYSSGVVALVVRGDEFGQIATFVPKAGQWYPIILKEPGHGEASPIVGASQAVYAIGRHVYAFSVPTQSWDVIELPEGAKPVPVMFANRTTVEHEDHVYMFSVKTGKWTDFDARAGKPAEPGAK